MEGDEDLVTGSWTYSEDQRSCNVVLYTGNVHKQMEVFTLSQFRLDAFATISLSPNIEMSLCCKVALLQYSFVATLLCCDVEFGQIPHVIFMGFLRVIDLGLVTGFEKHPEAGSPICSHI